jgi:Na+-transporting NADH:ubiquinone oxidoreductase subunit C
MSDSVPSVNIYKEKIFPIIFMFLITAVFIAMVSGIYLATRDIVIRNERLYLKEAVLYSAGIPVPDSSQQIDELYSERIQEIKDADGNVSYYRVLSAGGGSSTVGYVLPASGPGLWGEIDAVVGFNGGLSSLTGVDFTRQNETPGLGARISEEWFKQQFRGKTGPFTRVPEGTRTTDPREFDAITGATITSTAVQNILNKTIEAVPSVVGRE